MYEINACHIFEKKFNATVLTFTSIIKIFTLFNFNFILYQVKWYYKDTIRFSFSLDITNITIFARNNNRLNHGKSIYSMQLSDDFRSCLRYRVTAIKRRRMWVTGRNCDTRPSASVALNQLPAQLCVRWLQSWIHWVLRYPVSNSLYPS